MGCPRGAPFASEHRKGRRSTPTARTMEVLLEGALRLADETTPIAPDGVEHFSVKAADTGHERHVTR